MSEQKYNKEQLLKDMITEYFNRHPDAGLAWWMLPLEEQPDGFKAEMYEILWAVLDKMEENNK